MAHHVDQFGWIRLVVLTLCTATVWFTAFFAQIGAVMSGLARALCSFVCGHYGEWLAFILPGAVTFALLTTAFQHVVIFPCLPSGLRKRWLQVTILGASSTWLIAWATLVPLFDTDILGLEAMLLARYGD